MEAAGVVHRVLESNLPDRATSVLKLGLQGEILYRRITVRSENATRLCEHTEREMVDAYQLEVVGLVLSVATRGLADQGFVCR